MEFVAGARGLLYVQGKRRPQGNWSDQCDTRLDQGIAQTARQLDHCKCKGIVASARHSLDQGKSEGVPRLPMYIGLGALLSRGTKGVAGRSIYSYTTLIISAYFSASQGYSRYFKVSSYKVLTRLSKYAKLTAREHTKQTPLALQSTT